jgi:hypothetical protein
MLAAVVETRLPAHEARCSLARRVKLRHDIKTATARSPAPLVRDPPYWAWPSHPGASLVSCRACATGRPCRQYRLHHTTELPWSLRLAERSARPDHAFVSASRHHALDHLNKRQSPPATRLFHSVPNNVARLSLYFQPPTSKMPEPRHGRSRAPNHHPYASSSVRAFIVHHNVLTSNSDISLETLHPSPRHGLLHQ